MTTHDEINNLVARCDEVNALGIARHPSTDSLLAQYIQTTYDCRAALLEAKEAEDLLVHAWELVVDAQQHWPEQTEPWLIHYSILRDALCKRIGVPRETDVVSLIEDLRKRNAARRAAEGGTR